MEKDNGITLVALVVTIIVLLILAGVSINLVAGSNGILSKANNAVNANNLAKIKEELELKIAELQLDYYSDSNLQSTYTSANAYVKAELSKERGIVLPSGVMIRADSDGNLLYEGTENIGTLNADGTITINGIESGSGITPQTKYTVTYNANGGSNVPTDSTRYNNGDTVTVNFSSQPIRTGYNFLGWATSSSAKEPEYTSSGSFFITKNTTLYAVWDPIQSYHAQHPELHIPTGFSHTEGTVDAGYVIKDSEGNEFVWIPVANDEAYAKKLGTYNHYVQSLPEGNDTVEVLGNDITKAVKGDKLGITNILEMTIENSITAQQPEYQVIKKAGGFWVGRYEAGTISNTPETEITWAEPNAKARVVSKAGVQPVRQIYQVQALNIANNWKSGSKGNGTVAYQSGLITGSQWDAMCNFIGWDICDSDCSSWGNFVNTAGQAYTGYHSNDYANDWISSSITKKADATNRIVFPTATFKTEAGRDTAQKNIFDIAGNCWEWTTEIPQYNEENSIIRGACVDNDGSQWKGSTRGGYRSSTNYLDYRIGLRLVLYVE